MSTLKRGSKGKSVQVLQDLLNVVLIPSPNLPEIRKFGPKTEKAVIRFQKEEKIKPTGIVNDLTWAAIGKTIGSNPLWLHRGNRSPAWVDKLFSSPFNMPGSLAFKRGAFFEFYMQEYGGINKNQIAGLADLLTYIHYDVDVNDVRWAAYMLATVKHECADRWQPVEEYGKGQGRSYGDPVECDIGGEVHEHVYYGRGYVQLTWRDNYQKMSKALGLGEDELVHHPERALEPDISYKILSYGMRNGSFTGKKLSDYISDSTCDYKNARKIVNPNDSASFDLIAGYAEKLEKILLASLDTEFMKKIKNILRGN